MALPNPSPDLSALDLLVSVSELGSISAAAVAHGVSQPAASMRLRKLERVLGLHLLERAPTGARLTPSGQATVEWAAAVLRDVDALLVGASALRSDQRSHLRVAASMTVAEYLLPGWLQLFAAAAPEVQVALVMGNSLHVAELVTGGHADLGFVEGGRPPAGLRSREVLADELAVVVSPAHPWAKKRGPLSPEQLAATPLLLREPGSGTREVLAEALARHGHEPLALMELGSTTAIKAAVVAGTGAAVISSLAVAEELRTGQLVELRCEGLLLDRSIRAVWPRGRRLSDPAAGLVAIARRAAAA
jgi:molybdate transport repressor ModE-like protein